MSSRTITHQYTLCSGEVRDAFYDGEGGARFLDAKGRSTAVPGHRLEHVRPLRAVITHRYTLVSGEVRDAFLDADGSTVRFVDAAGRCCSVPPHRLGQVRLAKATGGGKFVPAPKKPAAGGDTVKSTITSIVFAGLGLGYALLG